jgi:D-aspartate ligase
MGLSATGIALARSLGRAGIDVVGVSSDDNPPSAHSRLFRYRRGPSLRRTEEALAFYKELADELGERPVLLPTGDPAVLFLSSFRHELEQGFRFFIPPAHELERITSKRAFAQLALELELPLPRTILPNDRIELESLADGLRFPCVVKPEYTELWRSPAARAAGLATAKALPLADREELLETYDRLAAVNNRLLVQETVQGPDENHFEYHALIDPNGRLRAEFAGRKLRLAPPHYGMGTYVESVDIREVKEVGWFVFSRLGYCGMGHLDLKRDERNGELFLFELNPRFSVWTGLDIACGIDFAYYYYLTCIGEDYEAPTSYAIGKRWLNLETDRVSMRTYSQDGTWSRPRWLLSLARASVWALFAFDDPMPSWVSFRRWVRHRVLARR